MPKVSVLMPRALRLAILYWRSGEPLPVDIAAELMALGYDVHALEARYCV